MAERKAELLKVRVIEQARDLEADVVRLECIRILVEALSCQPFAHARHHRLAAAAMLMEEEQRYRSGRCGATATAAGDAWAGHVALR